MSSPRQMTIAYIDIVMMVKGVFNRLTTRRVVKSKLKKTQLLMKDPFISRYIPKTFEYNHLNLKTMINKYPCVYIKPDTGSKGIGVIRLKALDGHKYELSYGKVRLVLSYQEVLNKLAAKLEDNKKYVIQQGIDMATFDRCPFDIRVVLQRIKDRWQLSLMSAKVAITEDAVVTNIARGNREFPVETVLKRNDQRLDPLYTLRHLIDISHQIAHILGSKYAMSILGLDMAVDKKGNIWFIEANTRPQCSTLGRVNDDLSYQKYLEAKRGT